MNEYRSVLERAGSNFAPLDLELESVLSGRDRKRWNQRIAAGVVGIAVFVAAIWIVTSVGSLDRSRESVVPAVSGTTGPAETEPAVTTPNGWDGYGIPPEGTRHSTPVEGTVVKRYRGHSTDFVYADGRVIWYSPGEDPVPGLGHVLERRLTPEGVDLVRSGAKLEDIPEGAWADAEPRLYVPSKYFLCFWKMGGSLDASAVRDMLPARAKNLLRGVDLDPLRGCPVVTTALARTLDKMLSKADRSPAPAHRGMAATAWFLRLRSAGGGRVSILPLLPHGVNMALRG